MMENLVQNNMNALSGMSDADKRDLQQTVNNEMQKMKIQEGDKHFPPPSFLQEDFVPQDFPSSALIF